MGRVAAFACALVLGAAFGRPAGAMVVEGTLLTNIASASFRAADNPVMQLTSFGVTATVLVMNPSIHLRKTSTPTMQCSGGTVVFCLYVINTSAMSSAFNVVVEDMMPGDAAGMGLAFVGGRTEWNPQAATVVYGYRTPEVVPKTLWPPTDADGNPDLGVVGPYYIRWAISLVGPNRSMMVCFQATVL